MKEKGRGVKRDYLEQILGKEKIGVYHLVEQIARLGKVLEKIPKWLWNNLIRSYKWMPDIDFLFFMCVPNQSI